MARLNFKFTDYITSKITAVNKQFRDLSYFFNTLGTLEWKDTIQRFDKGVNPANRAWKDPITYRRRVGGKHVPFNRAMGDRPMIDTGTLNKSIQYVFSSKSTEIGTNISYGVELQTSNDWKFLGLSPNSKNNIRTAYKLFMEHIL